MPQEMLPPELWLVIFLLVLESASDQSRLCIYRTFPELHCRLRLPWKYAGIDVERKNLRLVCRRFNELLRASPSRFLMQHTDRHIPGTVTLLYILPFQDARVCIKRLIAKPERFRGLVSLFIPIRRCGGDIDQKAFDVLCFNAPSRLSGVRNLTIIIHPLSRTATSVRRFWTRVNLAFPKLSTLVVLGELVTEEEDAEVEFNHVEILDVDSIRGTSMLYFPMLRHASFEKFSPYERIIIVRSNILESMLIHGVELGVSIDWRLFKQLRLLAVPLEYLYLVSSFQNGCPLDQLRIYITSPQPKKNGEDIIQLVKGMARRFTTIPCIIIDFNTVTKQQERLNSLACDGARLRGMGLACRRSADGAGRLIIERVENPCSSKGEAESVSDIKGLRKALTALGTLGSRRSRLIGNQLTGPST